MSDEDQSGFPRAHEPYPVPVHTGEVVGGVAVVEATVVQVRCGCTDSLEYEYGHERGES